MKTLTVHTKVPYQLMIGPGLLQSCAEQIGLVSSTHHVLIVTDDVVLEKYAKNLQTQLQQNGYQADLFAFAHGEPSKSMVTLERLYHKMAQIQLTRKDLVIALGGGVVGDLAGFAAATYLRGIDVVQIPTTLLAQIDSSVGGKTAIDIPAGKNLVGAFHQPRLVLCDTEVLQTLPRPIFCDGMAEVIKYAAIDSKALFQQLQNEDITPYLEDILYQCVDIKRRLVEQDEFDNGMRMLLNFGHTLGHAVESAYHYTTYSHGQGVALGMLLMTKRSEHAGLTRAGTTAQIRALCQQYQLPTDLEISAEALIGHSLNDKKRTEDAIRVVLLKEIGSAFIQTMPLEAYQAFIREAAPCK